MVPVYIAHYTPLSHVLMLFLKDTVLISRNATASMVFWLPGEGEHAKLKDTLFKTKCS